MCYYLLLIAEDVPTAGLHPLVHGGGGVNDEAVEDLEGLLCRGEPDKRSLFLEIAPLFLEKVPSSQLGLVVRSPLLGRDPLLLWQLREPPPFLWLDQVHPQLLFSL